MENTINRGWGILHFHVEFIILLSYGGCRLYLTNLAQLDFSSEDKKFVTDDHISWLMVISVFRTSRLP